ncbi:hypothetical protein PR048_003125 [Dryococelus australis]|uniref:Uncharacterized protein n=1 Tax=Dryococelus australis TaxID=614101 RepID=A0ABQ9INM6_9NEOP|nr:hypothetical protein PR048_003125 [Dryococelus australis]
MNKVMRPMVLRGQLGALFPYTTRKIRTGTGLTALFTRQSSENVSEVIWAALNIEVLIADVGEARSPRKPAFVRHDSHEQKSGDDPAGKQTGLAYPIVGGLSVKVKLANSCDTTLYRQRVNTDNDVTVRKPITTRNGTEITGTNSPPSHCSRALCPLLFTSSRSRLLEQRVFKLRCLLFGIRPPTSIKIEEKFGRFLTSRSSEPMRVIEVGMEQRWNEGAWETGEPREDPPTNGIVRRHSLMRISGSSRLTTQPPWLPCKQSGRVEKMHLEYFGKYKRRLSLGKARKEIESYVYAAHIFFLEGVVQLGPTESSPNISIPGIVEKDTMRGCKYNSKEEEKNAREKKKENYIDSLQQLQLHKVESDGMTIFFLKTVLAVVQPLPQRDKLRLRSDIMKLVMEYGDRNRCLARGLDHVTVECHRRVHYLEQWELHMNQLHMCERLSSALQGMFKMAAISTNTCITPPLHGHLDALMNPCKIPDCFATRRKTVTEDAQIVHWSRIHNILEKFRSGDAAGCARELRRKFKGCQLPRTSLQQLTLMKTKKGIYVAATSSGGMQGRGKRDISEETNSPAASSGTIPTCKNPGAITPGIEPELFHRASTSKVAKFLEAYDIEYKFVGANRSTQFLNPFVCTEFELPRPRQTLQWNSLTLNYLCRLLFPPPVATSYDSDDDRNTARLGRRSDEALGVRVSVAIAPSFLDLGRAGEGPEDTTALYTQCFIKRSTSLTARTGERFCATPIYKLESRGGRRNSTAFREGRHACCYSKVIRDGASFSEKQEYLVDSEVIRDGVNCSDKQKRLKLERLVDSEVIRDGASCSEKQERLVGSEIIRDGANFSEKKECLVDSEVIRDGASCSKKQECIFYSEVIRDGASCSDKKERLVDSEVIRDGEVILDDVKPRSRRSSCWIQNFLLYHSGHVSAILDVANQYITIFEASIPSSWTAIFVASTPPSWATILLQRGIELPDLRSPDLRHRPLGYRYMPWDKSLYVIYSLEMIK